MDRRPAGRKGLKRSPAAGNVAPMSRFRAILFDRQRTRWRDTREEALQDAIRRGWASREDYDRAPIYLGVGVKIEEASDAKKGRTP